ncbi:MBL fold metallo-hydrolase [Taibaiella sp. KBW10]|nr:MBL fold metallo-hydrolase [Taibaiella sp. KBW10]
MFVLLTIVVLLAATVWLYMRQDKFGAVPTGARLERMKQSPHYKDGVFQNIHHTPSLTEGYSMLGVLWDFIVTKYPHTIPVDRIPSLKTDLGHLNPEEDVLVWFGHSSYFIQLEGKKILVDPVLSGNASPIGGTNKSFLGTDTYTVADLPAIDYLIISHDHYDHLDYETVKALEAKTAHVICGLGVGAHFEKWGYPADKIIEKDWNEEVDLGKGMVIHTTPARHFSGRAFKRNGTLWMSMVLQTPNKKIFVGGDSGYDTHFAEIGAKYGPFDLAILENGQYNDRWHYIHCLPDEVIKAAQDLKAKKLFPVHSSKFKLANHPWDEPLIKIKENAAKNNLPLITPMIGEKVDLNNDQQQFKDWWLGLH